MGFNSVTMTSNIQQNDKTFKYCCDCKWSHQQKVFMVHGSIVMPSL